MQPRPSLTQPVTPPQTDMKPPVASPAEEEEAESDGSGRLIRKIKKVKRVVSSPTMGTEPGPTVPVIERIGASAPDQKYPPTVSRPGFTTATRPDSVPAIEKIPGQRPGFTEAMSISDTRRPGVPPTAVAIAEPPKAPAPVPPKPEPPKGFVVAQQKPDVKPTPPTETQKTPITQPAPPPKTEQNKTPAAEPPKAAAGSIDSRISAIDIDKLTDELERDILSTLSIEIEGLLGTQPAPHVEKKEVKTPTETKPFTPPPSVPGSRAPAPPRAASEPSSAASSFPVSRPMVEAPAAGASTSTATQRDADQRERRVAYRLGRDFDRMPANMRNELIKMLARTDDVKVREDVVIAIASNFEKLPQDIRVLLRTLASDRDSRVREEVAFELNRNFDKIAPELKNELVPILAKDVDVRVREDMVATIASHYDTYPSNIKDLLKILASDRKSSVRDQVTHEVLRNSDKIPEGIKAELTRLSEKAAITYARESD